jgi:hypothetical protein
MRRIRRRTALTLLVVGFIGWIAILYTGGPTESDPVRLIGPIAFDPMWALVGATAFALAYGVAGVLRPRLVD